MNKSHDKKLQRLTDIQENGETLQRLLFQMVLLVGTATDLRIPFK